MKLRTSFCKSITFKKDILRFAPVWVLYLVGMLMVLPGTVDYGFYDSVGRHMDDLIKGFSVVNILYAALVANLLFGDLYNTKMCYSLHAMPVRRESWLLTHLGSGFLFSLVPNCVAMLIIMVRLESYWFLGLYWLLAVTVQYLFFFGLATVSALLTGSRYAMLAVYAGFNFVSMLLYATLQVIYVPMFTGVVLNTQGFVQFSPVVKLYEFDFFTFSNTQIPWGSEFGSDTRNFYVYEGLADGWGYIAILAAVGLAAMAISIWLYRIRHLESAGDFVAFGRLKAPACIIITLCVMLCCALLGKAVFNAYLIWMAVGLFIGFFGSLMLLERRIKVFRKKTFLSFGLMVLVVGVSLLAAEMDWFGVERYIPRANQVKSVQISNRIATSYSYDYAYMEGSSLYAEVEDPEEIAQVLLAHQDILDRLNENSDSRHRVTLHYTLRSGATVTRSYWAPASGENYRIIRKFLYQKDSVLGFKQYQDILPNIRYMYYEFGTVPQAMWRPVLQALQADFQNGLVDISAKTEHYVEYSYYDEKGRGYYRTLWLLPGAETISLLNSPEMAMCYTDWDTFLADVSFVSLEDAKIKPEQVAGLLTAMRTDIENGSLSLYGHADGYRVTYEIMQKDDGEIVFREFVIDKTCKATWAWIVENTDLTG